MARIVKTDAVTDGEKIFKKGDMDGKMIKKSKVPYIQEFVSTWRFVYIEEPEEGTNPKKPRKGFNDLEKAYILLYPIRQRIHRESVGYPAIHDTVMDSPIQSRVLYQTGDNTNNKYGVRLESGVCLYIDRNIYDKLHPMEVECKNL